MASTNPRAWFTFGSFGIVRTVETGIAFDGYVKLYSLSTTEPWLRDAFRARLFLDFYYVERGGFYLRGIDSAASWPNTALIFVDVAGKALHQVLSSTSSYANWFVEPRSDGKFNLLTAMGPRKYEEYEVESGDRIRVKELPLKNY